VVSGPTNEERIRELCALAISARGSEWEPILTELRTLIHEHVLFLRAVTAQLAERETEHSSESKAAD
jgi:hypothetical protein